jgi:hypothetical protein
MVGTEFDDKKPLNPHQIPSLSGGGGGRGLLWLVHKSIIACLLTFVQGITVCLYLWDMSIVSIIWNYPTSLHSYIHLAVSLYFRVYYMFRQCSQFLSYYIVLQFWLSTILIITMNGVSVIWSWHIEQNCQQIDFVSPSADCSIVIW